VDEVVKPGSGVQSCFCCFIASQAELSARISFANPIPTFLNNQTFIFFAIILFRFASLRNISFARPNGQEEDRRAA
jgi:hypothetical protein